MLIRLLALSLALAPTLVGQDVRLPSSAPLFVLQGGDTPNVNHHVTEPSQAYAVDLGVVGGNGRELVGGSGARREDYYCWGAPVLSPVSGRVVATFDSVPDNAIGVKDAARPLGNHVVIQQGDRYFYVAHLRQHTVAVRAGEAVAAGQPIGRCGNSGDTDFSPHSSACHA